MQTGAAIVPVAISNTDVMMGKRTGVAYAGTIEMALLPPIETANATADDVMELLLKARNAVASALQT